MTEAKIQNLDTLQRSIFQYPNRNIPIPRLNFRSKEFAEAIKTNSALFAIQDYKASKYAQIKPSLVKEKSNEKKLVREYYENINNYKDYTPKDLQEIRFKAFEEIPLEDITESSGIIYKAKKLITKPNQNESFAELMYKASMNEDNGVVFFWGIKLDNGINKGIYQTMEVLPTHLIEILGGQSWMEPIYGYKMVNRFGKEFEFKHEDVVRISSYSPNYDMNGSHLYGTSKIEVAWDDLQIAQKALERKFTHFSNGDLRIIITPESGGAFDTGDIESQTWLKNFWNMIQKRFKQPNSQRAAVLDNPITVHQIQNAIDGDLIVNAEEQALRKACSVWKLEYPIIFPSLKGTTFDNQDGMVAKSLRNGVFPGLQKIEERWREDIIKPMTSGVVSLLFDYDGYPELDKDFNTEMDAWSKTTSFSDNEIRRAMGYEPIPDQRADLPAKYWDLTSDLNL